MSRRVLGFSSDDDTSDLDINIHDYLPKRPVHVSSSNIKKNSENQKQATVLHACSISRDSAPSEVEKSPKLHEMQAKCDGNSDGFLPPIVERKVADLKQRPMTSKLLVKKDITGPPPPPPSNLGRHEKRDAFFFLSHNRPVTERPKHRLRKNDGTKRIVEHKDDHFPSMLYMTSFQMKNQNEAVVGMLKRLNYTIPNDVDEKHIHHIEPSQWHISLSKTFMLPTEQIRVFKSSLSESLINAKRRIITFTHTEWMTSESGRVFLCLMPKIPNPVADAISASDQVVDKFNGQPYYQPAKPHISLAWVHQDNLPSIPGRVNLPQELQVEFGHVQARTGMCETTINLKRHPIVKY